MVQVAPNSGSVEELRRDHWRPQLRSGYLSIKDRQYYLYARKATIYVQDTMELRCELAGMPVTSSMSVKIAGENWTNFWIEGRTLVVSLKDLEGDSSYWAGMDYDVSNWDHFKSHADVEPDTQIYVAYDFYQWNNAVAPTGQQFETFSMEQYFRVMDCEVERHMPDDYVPGAPMVITDDDKELWDGRDHRMQCRVVEPRRSLEFNMVENLVHNPHFAYGYSGSPTTAARWYRTDPTGIVRVQGSGYVGHHYVYARPTGLLIQEVLINGGQPVVVEAWYRGSGEAQLELAYKTAASGNPVVDVSGSPLGYDPNFDVYSYRTSASANSDEWSRISAVLGTGTEFDPADALYPDACDRMEVRLKATSGYIDWGAAQVRTGVRAGQYGYVPMTGTVEYETDPTGLYRHQMVDAFPYEENWNADMNSINSGSHGGFLVIAEEGEPVDEGLGRGALTFDDPHDYGTGYPQGVVPWPTGVRHDFGRRHLPYSRIRGHQKLRQTQVFDLENVPAARVEVTEPRRPRVPADLLIATPASAYRDVSGVPYMIVRDNQSRREYVTCLVIDEWGNPIIGDWIRMVPSGQIDVDPTGAYTSRAGRVVTTVSAITSPATARLTFVHHESDSEGSIMVDIKS